MPDTSEIPDPQFFVERQELREVIRRLESKLIKTKQKTDDLVAATLKAAHDAMLTFGPIATVKAPTPDARRTKKTEVALWHLTDWQGAKVTQSYNTEVMRSRVLQFCDTAGQITAIQRADHPVRSCMIAFGGDMVEGLFNFPTQPFEIDMTIFEQYVAVSRLICDVVRRALSMYEKVTVVAEWGNHGRIGSKRSAVPRSDNFDRMCYELARQLLDGEKRLTWIENSAEDIQQITIGNYHAISIHGDEVGRNGFASPMTMIQQVARWKSGAYKINGERWHFKDCYVGHYHNHNDFSLPDGEGMVFYTGSTESDNRYAMNTMAASAVPSQRLHFIEPVGGWVTSQHKIRLA